MICGGRIYKGQDNYIELYVPDASGITGIEIYTGGELKITPEEYEIVDDNTIGINLTAEDLDPLEDGVIYYTVEYEDGGMGTNSNYYLKTPVGYTASTLDELIEEAYDEGYADGYDLGYLDGYDTGYTEGYESGYTDGSELCHDYSGDYFTIEALEDGVFNINRSHNDLYYSMDKGETWIPSVETGITLSSGDTISFKWIMQDTQPGETAWSTSPIKYNTIAFKTYGNYLSMVYGDDFATGTSLENKVVIPGLFYECTGLVDASNLKLVATQLGKHSYENMFLGCTNLVAAPELPAEILAPGCYMSMFKGCTSLTTAPELPATALYSQSYWEMFSGCTNLNYIKCLATDISASFCTRGWVDGVSSTGTFVKDANTTWPTGPNGIPSNWTVVDAS
jgi:hypothetical protein